MEPICNLPEQNIPTLINHVRCTGSNDGSVCINIQNGEVVSNIQLFNSINSSYVMFNNQLPNRNVTFPPSATPNNVLIVNNGQTLQTSVQGRYCFLNLAPGKYILELYDGNMSCEKTLLIEIKQPRNLTFKYVSENLGCGASSMLSYIVTVTGGTPPYFGRLIRTQANNGQVVQLPLQVALEGDPENVLRIPLMASSHTAGDTYVLEITDSNGCVASEAIPDPPFGPSIVAQIGAKAVSCFNGEDGEITVSISGGVPPYTVTLLGQVATNVSTTYSQSVCVSDLVECNSSVTFNNLRKGMYIVNVESGDGCIFTQQGIEVTQPPRIDYDNVVATPVTCMGKANGTIRISNIRGAYLRNDVRRELFVTICEGPEGFCATPQRVYPESRTDYEDPTNLAGTINRNILESEIPFPGFTHDPNSTAPFDNPDVDDSPQAAQDRTYMYRSPILPQTPPFLFATGGTSAITGTVPDTDVVFENLPAGCYKICINDEFGCGIVVEAYVACPAPTKFML
jgi:hypothetical protein